MHRVTEAAREIPRDDDNPPSWARWETVRPTQGAVGYVQVLAKSESFRALGTEEKRVFLRDEAVKVVHGPSDYFHVIDHHHWARAWFDMGLPEAPIDVVEDLSGLADEDFLRTMSERGRFHTFNEHGHRIPLSELPKTIGELPDDVYQSLAAFVRTAGVFENPGEFNAKFAWADFFRQHVALRKYTIDGFALMLAEAFACSQRPEATKLPGFIYNRGNRDHDKTIQN
ncbi:ParB-like protein [Paraburkholderia sp. BR13444]|uniref:ParB-like protein n=1 Tax=Paraburkholderia sp. BR13444 TaxID=3236997 RepID=UPI0034CD4D01